MRSERQAVFDRTLLSNAAMAPTPKDSFVFVQLPSMFPRCAAGLRTQAAYCFFYPLSGEHKAVMLVTF
jgi:hypothetical protein